MARHRNPPPGWRVLVRPLLVVGGLLVGIGLGELLLRLVLPVAPDKYYPWPPHLSHAFRPNPGVLPGISGVSHFSMNKWGIRAEEFSDDQDYRILAVGGSTTECLYLDDAEAWPRRLQDGLNASGKLGRVWVGNAGRSGLNTREHVAYLQYLPPQYPKLDAALLLVGVNDLLTVLQQGRAFDPNFIDTAAGQEAILYRAFSLFPGKNSLEFFDATGYGRLWRRLRQRRPTLGDPMGLVIDDVGQCYVDARDRRKAAISLRDDLPDMSLALGTYQRQLERIIVLCRGQSIRPVFMTQPTLWRDDLPPELAKLLWFGYMMNSAEFYSVKALREGMAAYNAKLLQVCAQNRVDCIDLAGMVEKDTSTFYDDMHFNEEGSRKVAAIVTEWWESHR